MSTLAQAIANAEGYGQPGAIPTQANNPGDLKIGDVGNGTINGITVFGSQQSGMDALNNQINLMTSGKSSVYTPNETLSQIGDTWSGGDPNWAKNVASGMGVSTSTPLSNLAPANNGLMAYVNKILNAFPMPGSTTLDSTANPLNPNTNTLDNGSMAEKLSTFSGVKSELASWTAARIVTIILGLIIVTGGIMMLKSTSTIINAAGKIGKKAVEVSA